MPQLRDYWAFISYSQVDQAWAEWLHRSLERYTVPKTLVGAETERGHRVPRRVYPVFRDRDELPTGAKFTEMLETALQNSKYLIVICSPNAVKSRWVNEEIKHFKKIGREDRIIYLIVDGEPCASDGRPGYRAESECFPKAARFGVDENGEITGQRTEPIAADVRPGKDGKTNAKLKILAGVLGVGYAELTRRDHARKVRRMWLLTSISLALLAVMTTLAVLFLLERNKAEEALAAQLVIAAQGAKNDAKYGESVLLYNAARQFGRDDLNFDPGFAAAWEKCRNLSDQFRSRRAAAFSMFAEKGSKLIVQDQLGSVQIRDLNLGETVWQSQSLMMQTESRSFCATRVFGVEVQPDGSKMLAVRDISDLHLVYEKVFPGHQLDLRDLTISGDGEWLFFRKLPSPPKDVKYLTTIINLTTGEEIEIESVQSVNLAKWWFSDDNSTLYHSESEGFSGMAIRAWSTENGKLLATQNLQMPVQHHTEVNGRLIVGFDNGFLACQDGKSLDLLWTAPAASPLPILDMKPDSDRVIVLYANRSMKVFNTADGKLLNESQGGPEISTIGKVVSNDNFALVTRAPLLQIWNNNQVNSTESWLADTVSSISFSPDGKKIHAAAVNGINRVWNVGNQTSRPAVTQLRRDGADFRYFRGLETEGPDVFFTTENGVYQLETDGSLVKTDRSPGNTPQSETANPNLLKGIANVEPWRLWLSQDQSFHLSNSKTGTAQILDGQLASAILRHIDGQVLLATTNQLGQVSIKTAEGEAIRSFSHPAAKSAGSEILMQNMAQPGGSMSFTPDGRYLVTSHGFNVFLWNWREGSLSWKSPEIPAGMHGRLFVADFVSPDKLIVYEGPGYSDQGFPAAYLVVIPGRAPTPGDVKTFGESVLKLTWEKGLLIETK
ncbi:MAG: toll/interleukin-1 receptor domain-containing protein [Verrucomicrobiales bacterium]|nr:toll/interleukin-1 receptor domain-containing protein [Verrucomicrobiales bacterium]